MLPSVIRLMPGIPPNWRYPPVRSNRSDAPPQIFVTRGGRLPGFADVLSAASELIASHYANQMLPQECPHGSPDHDGRLGGAWPSVSQRLLCPRLLTVIVRSDSTDSAKWRSNGRLMAFRREFYIQNRRWPSGRKNGAGKMSASARSASSLNRYRPSADWTAVLALWHLRATANARRLRSATGPPNLSRH